MNHDTQRCKCGAVIERWESQCINCGRKPKK